MPCPNCRQQYSQLLHKLHTLQAEIAYTKLESQLKQEACERHIALLEQNVTNAREEINQERELSIKELDRRVQAATKELVGRHEMQMQSSRNEQQRLQAMLTQLNYKFAKQSKVNQATAESYKKRLTKLQEQLYNQLDVRYTRTMKQERKELTRNLEDGTPPKIGPGVTLLEIYQQCMGDSV